MLLFLVALLQAGCAGTAGKERMSQVVYTADLGIATSFDFRDKTERFLSKYQYQIQRYEEFGDRLYIETIWKDRIPFEDEQELGIVEARSRFILQAVPRVRTGAGTKLNRVQFTGQNQLRFQGSDVWAAGPLTKMSRAYFSKCADDLRTEFRSGIRRY